ncbi:MAG: hypothetical protein ACTHOG_09735 [Marmoricola sp.]
MFFLWGWGRRALTRQLDATSAVIRSYRYAHLFFIFTLAWGGEYFLATHTDAGWARRPIAKDEALHLLGGTPLQPNLWKRFSLVLAVALVAGIGISSAVARSNTSLNGYQGGKQAWGDYLSGTKTVIDQLNTLGKQPLSATVRTNTVGLLRMLENSPDTTLNAAIANAVNACATGGATCNSAINAAGQAYNSALDEAGREGLVHVTSAP